MSAPAHASICRIGTAGWAIRTAHAALFPGPGSHLERYTRRFNAVEINSSFYKPHRRATYQRWAAAVPAGFAFSVKLPRAITHELRLRRAEAPLDAFLEETSGLGAKLGVLLIQLPPSLAFDPEAAAFFAALRARFQGHVAFEPRHPSWFTPAPERLLIEHRVARVAADPAVVPAAGEPGGWRDLAYFRLHGTPRVYYSSYEPSRIAAYAHEVRTTQARQVWCIFDNTAVGAATENALELSSTLA